MKKFIITTFLIVTSLNLLSQSDLVIDKIGKFRVNTPASVISEIGYNSSPVKIDNMRDYIRKVHKKYSGNECYKIIADTTLKERMTTASLHPNVEVYYIPNYKPTESILVEGITLKFINDSLYYINVSNPKSLVDAFKLKYGDPEISVEKKDQYYRNGLGIEIVKTDETYTQTWNTNNPNIKCEYILSIWHDDKGEKNYLQYLNIFLIDKYLAIGDLERKIEKDIKTKKEQQKKLDLDEL